MRGHYEAQDRERTAPARERVLKFMYQAGWYDLDEVSRRTGIRVGTVASKLRELCDSDHAYLGLTYDRRRVAGGVWEYSLRDSKPEQMPLFEGAHAN